MRHKGKQSRSVLTVNGRIRLRRIRWCSPENVVAPVDAMLDAANATFTRGLREMLCRLNQSSSSFAKTAENLQRLTSLQISDETARRIIEEAGRAAAELVKRGRLKFDWTAEDCVVPEKEMKSSVKPGETRVYLGCDGVKVPVVTDVEKRKRRERIRAQRRRCGKKRRPLPKRRLGADQTFKEMRVVALYDETQTRRAVAVTQGNCQATGRLIRALAVRLQTEKADQTIANIDGAPWIRNQLEWHSAAKEINLDYYHLRDYAQRTRREVFGEGTDAGKAWLDQIQKTILEEGPDAACRELEQWRRNLRGRKRKAADSLIHYIRERREIIQYKKFRERGWQIGSGPTEAQCKTTTLRIKGRGRRWDLHNAEALMALAALEASHAWDSWWATSTPAAA